MKLKHNMKLCLKDYISLSYYFLLEMTFKRFQQTNKKMVEY